MQPSALILVGALTPTAGILGSLAWPFLQRKFAWSNLKVLVILVVLASAIPAYGCLGFLNVFQGRARFGGLTTQGEMFGLAIYFGVFYGKFYAVLSLQNANMLFSQLTNNVISIGSVYGAFQGYARAFYAELLPPGEEARW